MTLKTDFNVSPYFDDFDELKQFNRILFKPSVALQARELTQLQTILQSQVERFGNFIFADGSVVTGCTFQYDDNIQFVKLRDQNKAQKDVNVNDFLAANAIVFSNTTGASARVVQVADGSEVTTPNFKTLFVKYIDGGSNNTIKSFSAGEELYGIYANGTQFQANVISSNATGYSTRFGVGDGIIYQKGNFIKVANQAIIVGKYTRTPSFEVGFRVDEKIVNAFQDLSLNDNAAGSANFGAPGADRLKLEPSLVKRPLNETGNTEPFFPLFTVDNGVVRGIKQDPKLDELGEKLAERTYEESGDYMIHPINIRLQEHLNTNTNFGYYYSDGTNGVAGDRNKLVALAESGGVAYVRGYRHEILEGIPVEINKGTEVEYQNAVSATQSYGNYVEVTELAGSFDAKSGATISLRNAAAGAATAKTFSDAAAPGSEIGTAKLLQIRYESGDESAPKGANYRVYLFDIRMASGSSFGDVRGLFVADGSGTGENTHADIVLTSGKAVLQDTGTNKLLFKLPYRAIKELKDSAGTNDTIFKFNQRANAAFSTSGTATVNLPGGNPGGTEVSQLTGTLSTANKREFVVALTEDAVTSAVFTGTVSSNTISGGTALDTKFNVGEIVEIDSSDFFVTAVTSTTMDVNGSPTTGSQAVAKKFPAGYIFNMSDNGGQGATRSIVVAGNRASFDVDVQETFTTTPDFSVNFPIERTGAVQTGKTVKKNRFMRINCSKSFPDGLTGVLSLGVSDVFKIRNVYVGTDFSETNTDRAAEFELVANQKDTHYENSGIRVKSSSTFTLSSTDRILVKFDYFEEDRSGGIGFFSAESYPTDDTVSDPANAINTAEIPLYRSTSGQRYDLRDVIDFRTRHGFSNGTPATTASASREAVPAGNTSIDIDNNGLYAPFLDENFTADLGYYLPRVDKLAITRDGEIKVIEGAASRFPVAPRDQADALTLGEIKVFPYPSISPAAARTFDRLDISSTVKLIEQRRYTMRDIGKLDRRVQRMEYYSALNLLEQAAVNIQLFDASGNPRFKNGIFADSFVTTTSSDTRDPDYYIAMDQKRGEIRPRHTDELVDLKFNPTASNNVTRRPADFQLGISGNTSAYTEGEIVFLGADFATKTAAGKILQIANTDSAFGQPGNYTLYLVAANGTFVTGTNTLKRQNATLQTATINSVKRPDPGDLVTLKYNHKMFVQQPFASKRRFLVNDLMFDWVGQLELDPPADIWKDTVNLPDVNVEIDLLSQFETIAQAYGTQWTDDWATVSSSTDVTTSTESGAFQGDWGLIFNERVSTTTTTSSRQRRLGNQLEVTPNSNQISFGDFVQDVSVIPFMRSRLVKFTGRGLRPNTRVFPYFDNVKVDEYCTPANSTFANSNVEGTKLVTDTQGDIFGYFRVPNDDRLKFRTGEKEFKLIDAENLITDADTVTTSAKTKYQAEGLELNVRGGEVNIQSGDVQINQVQGESRTLTSTSTRTRLRGLNINLDFGDPLAQSFYVPDDETGGVFLTRLEIFFFARSDYPVTVQIREMENGVITPRVVPFGETSLDPVDQNLCTESRNPSVFNFKTPVHVKAGKEYAFVVKPHGNDPKPRISVAELGGIDLLTSRIINKQPAVGMLFASQNDRTYRPIENEDIKFNLYRAAFTTVDKGVAIVENEPDDFFTIANLSGSFRNGEKIRGVSNVAIVDTGRGDLGTTSNTVLIPTDARVRGLTSGSIGLVRFISRGTDFSSPEPNTNVLMIDSANTYTPGETVKINWGGTSGYGNTVFAKVSTATGSAANATAQNTSTGFVQFIDSVFNRMTVNSSSGTFEANSTSYTGYIRGQQSNAFAQITAIRDIKTDVIVPKIAAIAYGNTQLSFAQKMTTNNYTIPSGAGSFQPGLLSVTNTLKEEKIIASKTNEVDNTSDARTYQARFTMTTNNERVSPVLGLKKAMSVLGVQNIINDPANVNVKEILPGGPAQARYISVPTTLEDGQDAEDLKVYTTAYKPVGSEIYVYGRFLAATDGDELSQKHWTQLTQVTSSNTISTSDGDYKEYEYKVPSSNASLNGAFLFSGNNDVLKYTSSTDSSEHNTFKTFQLKVVMTGSDSADVPKVTDIRAIALQV